MSCCKRWRWLWSLLIVLCYPASPLASPLDKLVAEERLEIRAKLLPAAGIVPGQRVALTLEIATDRWFVGGTRINIPEVAGLVILQNEQFASNSSETRQGQTWVIQRWTLDIYPQRAGDFTIPPVSARVQVNDPELGDTQGELTSNAVQFSAAVPESLAQADHWVAAPTFTVQQRFSRSLEGLGVGDAFEQEVVFEASDLMAMMLPDYEPLQLKGLAAYPSPAVLENSSNRGQSKASRRIKVSYVVESPGRFLLDARDYFWWDTRKGELVLASLPETLIEIAGASAARDRPLANFSISPQQAAAFLAALVLFAIGLRLAWTFLPRVPVDRIKNSASQLYQKALELRKPALAQRLNPGGSAGE